MKYSPQQNMKLIILDFDGTIADASEEILDAHRFVLNTMGREVPSEEELRGVIGANLLTTSKVVLQPDDCCCWNRLVHSNKKRLRTSS